MFYLQIPDKDFSLIQFPKIILLFALSSVFIIQNMYNIEHKIQKTIYLLLSLHLIDRDRWIDR